MADEGKLESYWIASTEGTSHPALQGKQRFDVAIVGGGISGLTAALLLSRAGKKVAVLERYRVAMGESGYTTAHLTELVDAQYHQLRRKLGRDEARLVRDASRAAISTIERLTREEHIDCDFEQLPMYLYTEDEHGLSLVEKEGEAAREAGMEQAFTREVPVPFPVRYASRFEQQAQFHPRKYLLGLARAAIHAGATIFERTRALDLQSGSPCRVVTEFGEVIADAVLDVANVPLGSRFRPWAQLGAYRSYALGLTVSGQVPHALLYDTDDPYHYTRSAKIGDRLLLIIGGEDHRTGSERDTSTHYAKLEDYARKRWPVEQVHYRWSGQIIEPADGLPLIGKEPLHPGLFMGTGYSGNGMTWGTVTGLLLTDLVMGRPNPWEKLLSPARLRPVAGGPSMVQEGVENAVHFVGDRLKGAEVQSPEQILPGEGALCAHRGKKAAIYRDMSGTIHALSPICPHMGCVVQWNGGERTWDCPCHGSRFSPTGEVVNGPSTRDLAKQDLE